MCGIAGLIGVNAENYDIGRLLLDIKHRGPDGDGIWRSESIQLGHVRLSIIDLTSSANQPMVDRYNGNVIIFNGEIYNYLELKAQVNSKYSFRTESDTEVILAYYELFGTECLKYLRGMFSFVLYDARKRKTLIARDRMGIKPFYYRQWNNLFLFASEMKALTCLGTTRETINEKRLFEFIANRQLDTDSETFFVEVKQLPPATFAWINTDGQMEELTNYWDFPPLGKRKWDSGASNELINIFSETINLHLRADVPVGCFVSGGLDSSSIACFAERALTTPLYTYSGILPYHHPENALIGHVTEANKNILPRYFNLDGEGFFDDLPSLIYHHDEPILDGSMYSHYKLCQMAGREGLKVLLSGAGGDELFGGYESHLYSHLGRLLQIGEYGSYFEQLRYLSQNSMYSYKQLMAKSLLENIPFRLRRYLKNRQLQLRVNFLETKPHVPHFYHEHKDAYFSNWVNNYRSWTVPPYLHYEDRNSMAFGLEIRVPFFDHVLIEFISQFDPSAIISGRSKSLMRDSFRGFVPAEILNQKEKYGFPSPIDHALRFDRKGKEMFFDNLKQVPFLKKRETEKLGYKFYKGTGDLTLFFRTLSYIIWYTGYSSRQSKHFNA